MVGILIVHAWTLAVVVFAGPLSTGCSAAQPPAALTPGGEQGKGQAEGTPKRGGTVNVNYPSRWNADPGMGQTPYTTWYYTGDPMLRRDPQTFELQPAVFESWTVSTD